MADVLVPVKDPKPMAPRIKQILERAMQKTVGDRKIDSTVHLSSGQDTGCACRTQSSFNLGMMKLTYGYPSQIEFTEKPTGDQMSLIDSMLTSGSIFEYKLTSGNKTRSGSIKKFSDLENFACDTVKFFDGIAYVGSVHREAEVLLAFCPTGKGQGSDNSCPPPSKGSGKDEQKTPQQPAKVPDAAKGETSNEPGTPKNPIKCGDDIKKAAKLLAEGKAIELSQPDQVATLLDEVAKEVKAAVDRGEQAPKINLCNVSVPGTNLFCAENIGIPRIKMPQLKGPPAPGTIAAGLPVDKKGEVDVAQKFIEHLQQHENIAVNQTQVLASHLRASQSELGGAQVAGMVQAAIAGKLKLLDAPIFVTRDNYILDGHHRWAADIGMNYVNHTDYKIPVYQLDTDIGTALRLANDFANKVGIKQKAAAAKRAGKVSVTLSAMATEIAPETTASGFYREHLFEIEDEVSVDLAFCGTGEGQGQDNSCSPANKGAGEPDQSAGKSSPGEQPKMSKHMQRLRDAIAKVEIDFNQETQPLSEAQGSDNEDSAYTGDVPEASELDEHAIEAMQEQMSLASIRRVDNVIDDRIDRNVDDIMMDNEVDTYGMDEQIYSENNLEARDIQSEVDDLVNTYVEENPGKLTEDDISNLKDSVSSDGLDGFDEALKAVPNESGSLTDAIQEKRDAAETLIQEKQDEWQQSMQDAQRENYINDYAELFPDDYQEIRQEAYHDFWENNPDVFPQTRAPESDGETSGKPDVIYDKWVKQQGGRDNSFVYNFKTPSSEYDIDISKSEITNGDKPPIKELYLAFFDKNGDTGQTGVGHGREVFDKVTASVAAIVENQKADLITFSAAGSEKSDKNDKTQSSRVDLYTALARQQIKLHPEYAAVRKNDPYGGAYFAVYKKDREEELKSKSASFGWGPEVTRLTAETIAQEGWIELTPATDEEMARWDTDEFWDTKTISLGPSKPLVLKPTIQAARRHRLRMAFCPGAAGAGQRNDCSPANKGEGGDTIAAPRGKQNGSAKDSGQQSGRANPTTSGPGPGGLPNGRGLGGSNGGVESSGSSAPVVSTQPLNGLPQKPVEIPGYGTVTPAPFIKGREVAAAYCKAAGIDYHPPTDYVKVDKERAIRIADAYEKMAHDPNNPEVKAAYDQMTKEVIAQWDAVEASGLKVEFIKPGQPDPYAASPRLATEDVRNNNHLWVFPTASGFGSDEKFDVSNNPLLADSGRTIGGEKACVNDLFRAVHDYFGHIKEGNGFRADGEENAWRSHSAMFTPLARKAMTSETRGQNSWLNYGPYGESNRTAKVADTVFADQKTGLLPDWAVNEGSGQENLTAAVPASPASPATTETAADLPPRHLADIWRTLASEGGFTYDPRAGAQPKKGWAVSVDKQHEKRFSDQQQITTKDLVSYWKDNKVFFQQQGNNFGGWIDHKGTLCLDLSILVDDRALAEKLARENDQDGIFNLQTKEFVSTRLAAEANGKGYSLTYVALPSPPHSESETNPLLQKWAEQVAQILTEARQGK